MKKRFVSLCLTMLLLFVLLPGKISAVDSGTCGENATWTLDDSGTLIISGTGDMKDYKKFDDGPWYHQRDLIKKIVIADGITSIGNYSFSYLNNLTDIEIPSSVVSIGMYAFEYCNGLYNVTIPDGVTSIGEGVFAHCNELTTATISGSVSDIGGYAFRNCYNLTDISIQSGVKTIGFSAFSQCIELANVNLPTSLTTIDSNAFYECRKLTKITVPNSVTKLGRGAFWNCQNLTTADIFADITQIEKSVFSGCNNLTTVTIPQGITTVEIDAFAYCFKLTDVNFPGTKEQWKHININEGNGHLTKATVHYSSDVLSDKNTSDSEHENGLNTVYIYNATNYGEDIDLPTNLLDMVTGADSAVEAVKQMVNGMTSDQKSSATGIDLATLYAETAVAKAASKAVEGNEVIISVASVADLETKAEETVSAIETALIDGGVTTARYLASTVTLTTDETSEITIKIDPDILTTEVDKIRVETPAYALTLKTADLAEDLTEVLTITAEDVGSGFAPGKGTSKTSVKVNLPKGRTTNPVTISLSSDSGATTYQAIVKTDGTATASKYNPATTTMDGKINTSGTYTVQTNERSFTDISNKSAEMQKAILYLTSKGIINGTSATQFSPDGTINRQQIAALLMRALGKVDNTAKPTFTDVPSSSSFYHAIASSQKHKVINGYSDNTFRGANVISRAQIVTVAGRVLTTEMNYKTPSNASTYLAKYSDTVPEYAQEMVALATRENLVVYRTDGTFSGAKNMTRGDAAIILYRLFQKIW